MFATFVTLHAKWDIVNWHLPLYIAPTAMTPSSVYKLAAHSATLTAVWTCLQISWPVPAWTSTRHMGCSIKTTTMRETFAVPLVSTKWRFSQAATCARINATLPATFATRIKIRRAALSVRIIFIWNCFSRNRPGEAVSRFNNVQIMASCWFPNSPLALSASTGRRRCAISTVNRAIPLPTHRPFYAISPVHRPVWIASPLMTLHNAPLAMTHSCT